MKAKHIITGLLFSLLLIFSGCTTMGYGPGGSRYLYRGYIYGGTGPYWYPGYGYYGDYGEYPYWDYPPGGIYYYPGSGLHHSHRDDSWSHHGYVNNDRRFRSHDQGNAVDHAGRHYTYRDEGSRHYHGRAEGAGHGYSRRDYNGSNNSIHGYTGGESHGTRDRG